MAAQPNNNDDLDQLLDSKDKTQLPSFFFYLLLLITQTIIVFFFFFFFFKLGFQVLSMISRISTSVILTFKGQSFLQLLLQRLDLSSQFLIFIIGFCLLLEVKKLKKTKNNNNLLLCLLGFKDWVWVYLTLEPRKRASKSFLLKNPMYLTHLISSEPKPQRLLGVWSLSLLPDHLPKI